MILDSTATSLRFDLWTAFNPQPPPSKTLSKSATTARKSRRFSIVAMMAGFGARNVTSEGRRRKKRMKIKEQVKAMAELDGFTNISIGYPESELVGTFQNKRTLVPNYPTSYDAVIPVIQKHIKHFEDETTYKFNQFLGQINQLHHTPAQLCEALLRATGRWRE
jgi:hypothetical protein